MRAQTLLEARWILLILGLCAVATCFVSVWLTLIFLTLVVFTIAFFRDPERPVTKDPNLVVAPADGRVSDIVELDENEVLKTRTRRVGIFLSIFDVHTNRAPIAGRIVYRQHHQGLCLDARNPECSTKNEALTWAIEGAKATLVVRQITGAIARRIVPWAKVGDEITKGFRFGMIRFGSRTEVYLPLTATIEVKVGDRVAGAQSVIARLT